MYKKTFHGGVHPYDGKEFARDIPFQTWLPKGDLVFHLNQHIGKPAKPLVQKGDSVLAGQIIAEADGFVSANIISSVSGTVKAIEKRENVLGTTDLSIVVVNDGQYTLAEGVGTEEDPTTLTTQEILAKVKAAGIVGLGGAGFPTHVKLAPKDPAAIKYVIANGAECEPYLTSDYRIMLEQPEKLVGGLKVMLQLFDGAKGYICIEDNKPEGIAKLQELVEGEANIEVQPLKTKYPQGAERMLIYAVTGETINSSMLPADAGCIVDNVDTVVSIYEAVAERKPLMQRIVTVTGDGVNTPSNFRAPVGMDFQELLDAAGGLKGTVEKVISGGPMMGFAMFDYHVPVTKTTSALLVLTKDEVSRSRSTACINCGRCVSECPEHLLPTKLATFAEHRKEEAFVKYNGMECCECGCCSYVCPAKRPLVQEIRSMRKMVMANRKKK